MNDSNDTIKIKKFIEENYDLAVEKIEKVKTGAADRPIEDVKVISMKIIEK